MKLEQISSWNTYEAIEHKLTNAEIKSWLLEQGPITKRIKSIAEFRLELIQDELSDATDDEILFLKIDSEEISEAVDEAAETFGQQANATANEKNDLKNATKMNKK